VAMQPQGRNGFIFAFLEVVPLQRLRLHRPGPLVLLLGKSSCGQPPNDERKPSDRAAGWGLHCKISRRLRVRDVSLTPFYEATARPVCSRGPVPFLEDCLHGACLG
jgi:hypothetical protein